MLSHFEATSSKALDVALKTYLLLSESFRCIDVFICFLRFAGRQLSTDFSLGFLWAQSPHQLRYNMATGKYRDAATSFSQVKPQEIQSKGEADVGK